MPGEEVCGDSWAIEQQRPASTLMVADGLGHGPELQRPRSKRFGCSAATRVIRSDAAGLHPRRLACHPGRGGRDRALRCRQSARSSSPASATSPARWSRNGDLRRMVSLHGHCRSQRPQDPSVRLPVRGRPRDHALRRSEHDWSLDRYPGLAYRSPDADRRRAVSRSYTPPRRCHGAGRQMGWPWKSSGVSMTWPIVTMPIEPRPTSSPSASARDGSPNCSASSAGPDAHRHRRVGDRPQRLQLCGRRTCRFLLEDEAHAAALSRPDQRSAARASPTCRRLLDGRYRSQTAWAWA